MSKSKIRALELENARLRGVNEALEKIVAAYRAERAATVAAPAPNWPEMLPAVLPAPAPPVHGGFCACSWCVPPWGVTVTCETRPSADLIIGGPQRPGWDVVYGGTHGATQ